VSWVTIGKPGNTLENLNVIDGTGNWGNQKTQLVGSRRKRFVMGNRETLPSPYTNSLREEKPLFSQLLGELGELFYILKRNNC
jgi:hypothetical protein